MFRRSREQRFWSWFLRHDEALFNSEAESDLYLRDLTRAMSRVHSGLVWQVSAVQSGRRELVISADGDPELFSTVEALADAAPQLLRWTIVRFRPREPEYAHGGIRMEGTDVRASSVECTLATHGRDIGIDMYIPGCTEAHEPRFIPVALLFLDGALGEYDAVCKVAAFAVRPFDEACPPNTRFPFSELRERFDRLFDELCEDHHEESHP
jgi:hypothetical protein